MIIGEEEECDLKMRLKTEMEIGYGDGD